MRTGTNRPYKKTASWWSGTCRGAEAHRVLTFFLERLEQRSNRGLGCGTVRSMEDKLPELSAALEKAVCNKLYAYAMDVLRQAAFVDTDGTNFVLRCYGLIRTIWNKQYESIAKTKTNPRRLANPVFDPDSFVGGWIRDLEKVRAKSLPSYIDILSCDGLASSGMFLKALQELEARLVQDVDQEALAIMDKCGVALIRHVLDPLLITDRNKAIESLVMATKIACTYALNEFDESMEGLDELIRHLGKPQKRKTGKGRVFKADIPLAQAYSDVLPILSDTYQKARQKGHADLCFLLADIIPHVGGWWRDRRRKAPDNLNIVMEFLVGKDHTPKKFSGTVKELVRNFGEDKPYYHVCFDDLADCFPIENSEQRLPGEEQYKSVMLCITDKAEEKYTFREALAVIKIPDDWRTRAGSEVETYVRAVRGWRYKYENQNKVGIVFWLQKPPVLDSEALPPVLGDQGEAEQSSGSQKVKYTRESDVRFRKGGQELLQDICQWFERLSSNIQRNRRYRGYWTRSGKKGLRPVDEQAIDGQIRGELKEFVESHAGSLSSQEDTGIGPCDYLIRHGDDKVVIELKPSYGKWKQGIDTQLPRYMKAAETQHGLFVIIAFESQFQKGSEKYKCLLRRRNKVCKGENIRIDIVVINCDKPSSGSTKKALPSLDEIFLYSKGPSPSPEVDHP